MNPEISAVQQTGQSTPPKHWYVLRDLKRPNAKDPAYKVLQGERYNLKDSLFVPMEQRVYTYAKKKVVVEVPYLTDMLFVYESREVLDPIIREIETLQYRFVRGGKQNDPMKVRDAEMTRFIDAVRKADKVEFFKPEDVPLSLYGKQIRIIGGRLDGYEGRLMSKRGSKRKRLIIDLQGFLSAVFDVETDYVQVVGK